MFFFLSGSIFCCASGRVLPPVAGRSRVRVAVSSHCTGEGKACPPDPAQSGSSLHWVRPFSFDLFSSFSSSVLFWWQLWQAFVGTGARRVEGYYDSFAAEGELDNKCSDSPTSEGVHEKWIGQIDKVAVYGHFHGEASCIFLIKYTAVLESLIESNMYLDPYRTCPELFLVILL